MSTVSLLFAALFGVVSWLMPNHSVPWLSFHGEAMMMLACLIALVGELLQRPTRPETLSPLTLVTLGMALVPLLQLATGLIRYAGDGWMVFGYLLAFALAQLLGQRLGWRWGTAAVAEALAGLFLTASLISVGLQLYQWLELLGLGIFAVEMPPPGTPFANFAQANHLATALFLGLVSALHLYERRRIGMVVTAATALFLAFGMVMTGSRTAWLAMVFLVVTLIAVRRRLALRLPAAAALGLGVAFVAFVAAWPVINDLMLLAPGRSLANQANVGPRPLFYATMFDAVSQHPWAGYGWNQGLMAQGAVLDAHPSGGRLMESSHNLILDLTIWNGLPLALAIVGLLGAWAWRQVRACRDSTAFFLLIGLGGVAVHAMLEFPLSYAYFLLPVGVMMGLLDAALPLRWQLRLPRFGPIVVTGAAAALMGLVTTEYLRVEANTQVLSWELARIGTGRIISTAPELTLLTQWREYLRYARLEPRAGMSDAELAWMQQVVERFPFSTPMRQYATANALNGRPEIARLTMERLCKLHSASRCRAELQSWLAQARSTSPQLAAVPLPAMPARGPGRVAAAMPALVPVAARAP